MPNNKNQHYVPRCHFKPFSFRGEGLAINLFNHARSIIRENVPISGQCAKSYFYGEDLGIEKQLQAMEGQYARIVRSVEAGTHLSDADLKFLCSFVFLQWCRTDAALRRRREVLVAMDEMAHSGIEELRSEVPDLSQKAMVIGSLRVWASSQDEIADLRVVVLRNSSRVSFVTSDDPAVVTNRVFLQRMRDPNFGIASAGIMIMMPLGPRHAVMCYDPACYAPIIKSGQFVDIKRDQDIRAFNELQFLNSLANIYFAGPIADADRVAADFEAVAQHRPTSRFAMWQGVSEGIEGHFEVFRRIEEDERVDPRATRIQSYSPLYPSPAHWMSNFPMRQPLLGWLQQGATVGPMRAAFAHRHRGLRPVKLGIGPLPNRAGERPDRVYQRLSEEQVEKKRSRDARMHTTASRP